MIQHEDLPELTNYLLCGSTDMAGLVHSTQLCNTDLDRYMLSHSRATRSTNKLAAYFQSLPTLNTAVRALLSGRLSTQSH